MNNILHPELMELLQHYMLMLFEDYCEDKYPHRFRSGWVKNIEFCIWEIIWNKYYKDYNNEAIQRIRKLYPIVQGWWVWPKDEDRPRFVNAEEWERLRKNQ